MKKFETEQCFNWNINYFSSWDILLKSFFYSEYIYENNKDYLRKNIFKGNIFIAIINTYW